jgi:hypothetical protein
MLNVVGRSCSFRVDPHEDLRHAHGQSWWLEDLFARSQMPRRRFVSDLQSRGATTRHDAEDDQAEPPTACEEERNMDNGVSASR